MKKCPECAEEIQDAAIKCRHCGARFRRGVGVTSALGVMLVAALAVGFWRRDQVLPLVESLLGRLEAPAAPAAEAPAAKAAARKLDVQGILPSVVRVENVGRGTGSGFLVSAEGHILTSAHVVERGKSFRIQNRTGAWWTAKIADEEKEADLALLLVEVEEGKPLDLGKPLPLGDATQLKATDPVTVIGYPLGVTTPAVTQGIVSALPVYLSKWESPLVQIDASMNPGNSGGPLLDSQGKVVGIVTGKIFGAEAMNYASPVNLARDLDLPGARLPESPLFAAWVSGVESGRKDAEKVMGGGPASIKLVGAARTGDGLMIFVGSFDGAGTVDAGTAITLDVEWDPVPGGKSGGCVSIGGGHTLIEGEEAEELAKKYQVEGDGPLVAIALECGKLADGGGRNIRIRATAKGARRAAELVLP